MFLKQMLLVLFLFTASSQIFSQDDLDNYIKKLRQSEATGGKETAFLSAGSSFLYGQGYFESKQFDLAAMYFIQALDKEADNPYFNYQLAISLLKQNNEHKALQAQPYLQKAFELNPNLKTRYESDVPGKTDKSSKKNTTTNVEEKKPIGLKGYLEELKNSRATGGKKTVMNSAGRDVLYGYEYYENGEFVSAATNFRLAVSKDEQDIYANYLLGVSLAAQGKSNEAAPYLTKAFAGDAGLKDRFANDTEITSTLFKKKEAAKKPVTTPATKPVYGGALVFGNYVCSETVWNGPNQSPAYRHEPKGYFQLRSNGTYRWLDDGAVGKYSYDSKTGAIKFLSGYLAPIAKSSKFQPGKTVAQITVSFSESYKWECGCNK
jgi:tetratricopeptide (TPR) repeat protein